LTYHGDDLLLDQRRKRDELKEERKVELYSVSSILPRHSVKTYRRNQKGERNGLLSASHLDGFLRSVMFE
jgi:hypothetical protein